jgi:hypothetical protein
MTKHTSSVFTARRIERIGEPLPAGAAGAGTLLSFSETAGPAGGV